MPHHGGMQQGSPTPSPGPHSAVGGSGAMGPITARSFAPPRSHGHAQAGSHTVAPPPPPARPPQSVAPPSVHPESAASAPGEQALAGEAAPPMGPPILENIEPAMMESAGEFPESRVEGPLGESAEPESARGEANGSSSRAASTPTPAKPKAKRPGGVRPDASPAKKTATPASSLASASNVGKPTPKAEQPAQGGSDGNAKPADSKAAGSKPGDPKLGGNQVRPARGRLRNGGGSQNPSASPATKDRLGATGLNSGPRPSFGPPARKGKGRAGVQGGQAGTPPRRNSAMRPGLYGPMQGGAPMGGMHPGQMGGMNPGGMGGMHPGGGMGGMYPGGMGGMHPGAMGGMHPGGMGGMLPGGNVHPAGLAFLPYPRISGSCIPCRTIRPHERRTP
jgi:hypothetical protein